MTIIPSKNMKLQQLQTRYAFLHCLRLIGSMNTIVYLSVSTDEYIRSAEVNDHCVGLP